MIAPILLTVPSGYECKQSAAVIKYHVHTNRALAYINRNNKTVFVNSELIESIS